MRTIKTIFSTENIEPGDRFDAWRENMRPLADVQRHGNNPCEKNYKMEIWELGGVTLCRESSSSAYFSRTASRIRQSYVDHYYLYVVQGGSYWIAADSGVAAGRVIEGAPGSIALQTLSQAFHGEMRGMRDCLIVILPREKFFKQERILDANCNSQLNNQTGVLLREYLLLIANHIDNIAKTDADHIGHSICELVKGSVRLDTIDSQELHNVISVTIKSRIRRFIDDNISDKNLSAETIGRKIGISRSALYRLFNLDGGVKSYIEKRRVFLFEAAVYENLGKDCRSELVRKFGFRDYNDMYNLMKKYTGLRDSSIRRISNSCEGVPFDSSPLRAALIKATHSGN